MSAEFASVIGAVLTQSLCLKWSTAPVDMFVTVIMFSSHCDPNPDPSVRITTYSSLIYLGREHHHT